MGQIRNLRNGELPAMQRSLRKTGTATPMNSSAIGREGLLVYGGGVITIQNGGLMVTGTATIVGELIASGIITFTGEVTISGPLDVTGLMQLTGDLAVLGGGQITAGTAEINSDGSAAFGLFTIAANGNLTSEGTLDIKGKTTLRNDLDVVGDGKIVAGQTTIRPSGVINFGPSMTIGPDPGSGTAAISDGFAKYYLTPGGGNYFHQFQGGAYVDGRVFARDLILSTLPETSSAPNLYIDPVTGVLKRSTA
jgi:hypothetical protein